MRVLLLGAVTLLLSACGSGHMCPMHITPGGIVFDTRAYLAAHPDAAQLCPASGSCRPLDRAALPADRPGTERLDFTIATAAGQVLLHATTTVQVRYRGGSRGCHDAVLSALVTVAADGKVTSN